MTKLVIYLRFSMVNKIKKKLTNSPFRYPGGKFYARKLILACLPPHEKYCELFAGGHRSFLLKIKLISIFLTIKMNN